MGIEIEGLDEVRDMFRLMLPREAKRLAAKTMQEMAESCAEITKQHMPVRYGNMVRSTKAKPERARGKLVSSTVICRAFYWSILENGDGPDGVEHAFGLRAREQVRANAPREFYAAFNAALTKVLTR